MMRAIKKRIKFLISPKYKYLDRFQISSGDVVIDLGANVGEVAEYFLLKDAQVYAYEPNTHAYAILQKRLHNDPRAHLHASAVSNFNGTSKLWLHNKHDESEVEFSQAGSLQAEKSNVGDDFIEVDVLDIKDVLKAHDHIRLIKIDIEGGEYEIIDDLLAAADKIDYILLETHGHKNEAFREKEIDLQGKISASPHKDKIFTDWF